MNLYLDCWIWKLSLAYGELWDEGYKSKFRDNLLNLPSDIPYIPPDMAININDHRPRFTDYFRFLWAVN